MGGHRSRSAPWADPTDCATHPRSRRHQAAGGPGGGRRLEAPSILRAGRACRWSAALAAPAGQLHMRSSPGVVSRGRSQQPRASWSASCLTPVPWRTATRLVWLVWPVWPVRERDRLVDRPGPRQVWCATGVRRGHALPGIDHPLGLGHAAPTFVETTGSIHPPIPAGDLPGRPPWWPQRP